MFDSAAHYTLENEEFEPPPKINEQFGYFRWFSRLQFCSCLLPKLIFLGATTGRWWDFFPCKFPAPKMRRSAVSSETKPFPKNPSTKIPQPGYIYVPVDFQLYIAPIFQGGWYLPRGGLLSWARSLCLDRGLGAEYPWWFKPVRYITHVLMFGTIGAGACAMVVGSGWKGGRLGEGRLHVGSRWAPRIFLEGAAAMSCHVR